MASEGCLECEKNNGLRLSLSLGYGGSDRYSLKELSPIHPTLSSRHGTSSFHETFHLCDPQPNMGLVLTGLDVRRVSTEDEEEKNGVSSPNSTISSSISLKRIKREKLFDPDASHRKKLRLSNCQCQVLEDEFKEHDTLNLRQKMELAKQLNLRPRQVEVWFQNKRARIKLKKIEVESVKLKRRCEDLTTENMRLQKQLMELRALKFSPQLYMHINPTKTLTVCCQYEHLLSPYLPNRQRRASQT